jgi:2,4-dienoyl-CoA reductase-like NADH-dependent reductase (Old Yellow Enzyme family)
MNSADSRLLFTPIRLRDVITRNRIVVSPMCQYQSVNGLFTDWHLVHLGQFAIGGAGIIFCEETAVEERGRKSHNCAGIYNQKQITFRRRVNGFLTSNGSIPAIQIGHAGRVASALPPWEGHRALTETDARLGLAAWKTVGPSNMSANEGSPAPQALSVSEIKQLIKSWRDATLRSADADYEILEIHAAHGYLIHQFLSPMSNKRQDAYGGNLEGRMRFCLEIIETVREAWPKTKPLFLRVSAVDGSDQWHIEDTVTLCREAKRRGVDVVTASSGGFAGSSVSAIIPRVPGYQVPFADRIKKDAEIKTLAVGLITEATQAENILQENKADLIGLARELLWNPRWPVMAAKELKVVDYFEMLPPLYSWWLKRREKIRA